MKPYLVDVPVRVQVWSRPHCQKKQMEILKQARPSTLILVSDGGRTPGEMERVRESRKIVEEGIDWECTVHKLYFEENQGMYKMMGLMREFIWSKFDRCVFLEDDYVPAVSFFRYCAELLEKYKDDQRIGLICGLNKLETYNDPAPNDYFFTKAGSVWGLAYWKRVADDFIYPLPYANDEYVLERIKENAPNVYNSVDSYSKGQLHGNHVPGTEYFLGFRQILQNTICIVPTKNMICNIGDEGEHFHKSKVYEKFTNNFTNIPTYEIEGEIKHPKYVIEDKKYERLMREAEKTKHPILVKILLGFELLFGGKLFYKIKQKVKSHKQEEK